MRRGQHSRPEEACSIGECSQLYYDDRESSRYTTTKQTQAIQSDLTLHALKLLNIHSLSRGEEQHGSLVPHVLNVGCGSGLCSRMLHEKGIRWVGFDVSQPMLRHAVSFGETARICSGNVFSGDFRHELPLRSEQFGAVLSISAIQWLLSAKSVSPEKDASLFMKEIDRVLEPGGCFIAQLYVRDDVEIGLLVQAARQSGGLSGGIFIDFPHTNRAKKKYMCLCKEKRGQHAENNAEYAARQICLLAWPLTSIGCMLSWLEPVCNATTSLYYDAVCARLHHEHIRFSTHIIRLLRRCIITEIREQEKQQSGQQERMGCIEYGIRSHHFAPCGGTIPIHIWSDTKQQIGRDVAKAVLQSVIGNQSKITSMSTSVLKSPHNIHGPWPAEISRIAMHNTSSVQYFQLKALDTSNEKCKTAILTAPKIPTTLLVVTCMLPLPAAACTSITCDTTAGRYAREQQDIMGEQRHIDRELVSFLQTYKGTVAGADVILSENVRLDRSSMAMVLYFPALQQQRDTSAELQHISQTLIALFSNI